MIYKLIILLIIKLNFYFGGMFNVGLYNLEIVDFDYLYVVIIFNLNI